MAWLEDSVPLPPDTISNLNKKIYTATIFSITAIVCVLMFAINQIHAPSTNDAYYREVAGSGSMQPLINKNVYPALKTQNYILNKSDKLVVGRMYVYVTNTTHVIHRLVGRLNTTCGEYFIFMGDNNNIIDERLITRNMIKEEVIAIKYR